MMVMRSGVCRELVRIAYRSADALEKFLKVAAAAPFLEAHVVHREALDEILLEAGVWPAPKLGAARALDARFPVLGRVEEKLTTGRRSAIGSWVCLQFITHP